MVSQHKDVTMAGISPKASQHFDLAPQQGHPLQQPHKPENSDGTLLQPNKGNIKKIQLSHGRAQDAANGSVAGHMRDFADRYHLLFLLRIKLLKVIRSVDKMTRTATDDKLAWSQVARMLNHVNAYPLFLERQNVTGKIKKWEDLPISSKKNYVKETKNPEDLLVGNAIPINGQCDQSSGTTGEPTVWFRDFKECDQTGRHLRHAMKASVDGPVVSVLCFALGPWATGMTLHNSLSKGAMEVAIGPDLTKAFNFIKKQNAMAHRFEEKTNYVILGYPPFLQALGEKLQAEGIELHPKMKLWAVGGGEPMSCARRNAMLQTKYADVRSSFGASDLTINIGAQDLWDVRLENICKENQDICKAIFGRNTPPSVFHYDPGSYKIEQAPYKDENGRQIDRILFTQLKKVTCPKVRYDLGDEGGTSKQKDVEKILKSFGITDMPSRTHELPLLYIYGRAENAVPYNGSKVTPEHLEEGLILGQYKGNSIKSSIESYALNSIEDATGNAKIRILLEMKEGISKDTLNTAEVRDTLINEMRKNNEDFDKACDFATDKNVDVIIFNHHEGPNFHPNPNTKKVYIFEGDVTLRSGEVI